MNGAVKLNTQDPCNHGWRKKRVLARHSESERGLGNQNYTHQCLVCLEPESTDLLPVCVCLCLNQTKSLGTRELKLSLKEPVLKDWVTKGQVPKDSSLPRIQDKVHCVSGLVNIFTCAYSITVSSSVQ